MNQFQDIAQAIINLRSHKQGYNSSHDIETVNYYLRSWNKYKIMFMQNEYMRKVYATSIPERYFSNQEIVHKILENRMEDLRGLQSINKDITLGIFSATYRPVYENSIDEVKKYFEAIERIKSFHF